MSELDNIKELEAELRVIIESESRMMADDGRNPIQALVDRYAVGASLYSDPKRIEKMIANLEKVLESYIDKAGKKGRFLGKNAINKFIKESERRAITQKTLGVIARSNEKSLKRRTALAFMELGKEKVILKSDIAIYRQNAKIAGFTDKEILVDLVRAGKEKAGVAQGFAKRMKRVAVDAVRREKSASEIDEYRKVTKLNELWQWIAISTKPCPDCDARAGRTLPIDQWERMGLPGSGRTICGRACKCRLMPLKIADERFPSAKAMKFDSKNLVLTTASEVRTLKSKKATGGK